MILCLELWQSRALGTSSWLFNLCVEHSMMSSWQTARLKLTALNIHIYMANISHLLSCVKMCACAAVCKSDPLHVLEDGVDDDWRQRQRPELANPSQFSLMFHRDTMEINIFRLHSARNIYHEPLPLGDIHTTRQLCIINIKLYNKGTRRKTYHISQVTNAYKTYQHFTIEPPSHVG